jgi:hypothetical protein
MSTDERISRVRALDEAGVTASGIASRLGTSYGSIVTFAAHHRILLTTSDRRMPRMPAFQVMPALPPETWEAVHPNPATLLDRTGCCWPVGEAGGAEQLFCDGPIHRRGYCEHHHKKRLRESSAVDGLAGIDGKPKHRTPVSSQVAMRLAGVPARRVELAE